MNEEPNRLHNVQEINSRIVRDFKGILDAELRIAELTEEYITPLKDSLKTLRKNLSADTDIDSKDIDLHYKLYKRQEMAKRMEDEEDRNRIQDNLRTVFGAMAQGKTLDFIDVIENGHTPQSVTNDQDDIEAEEAA